MTRSVELHLTVSSVSRIVESPYEGNSNAEIGERLFEYTQTLMDPLKGLASSFHTVQVEPSSEAIEVFGEEQARSIITTNREIATSGILYSCDWTEGIIHGKYCGCKLKKELLLVCLQAHRIARADCSLLKVVIKDLDVWKIFRKVLSRWKLRSRYPFLCRCDKISSFRKKQTKCLKCILFVARSVVCMDILEWNFPLIADDTSLKTKVHACFDILENVLNEAKGKVVAATKTASMGMKKRPERVTTDETSTRDSTLKSATRSLNSVPKTVGPLLRDDEAKSTKSSTYSILQQGEKNKSSSGVLSKIRRTQKRSFSQISSQCENNVDNQSTYFLKDRNIDHDQSYKQIQVSVDDRHQKLPQTVIDECSYFSKMATSTDISRTTRGRLSKTRLRSSGKDDDFQCKSASKAQLSHDLFTTVDKKRTGKIAKDNLKLNADLNATNYVSDNTITEGNTVGSNYWYPFDPSERLLNHIQSEAAWLFEESMFCSRRSTIDWVFVMKYASPSLKVVLRQMKGSDNDEDFEELLGNAIISMRFEIVRRDIRRKLLKNIVRQRMKTIVPRLRKASHPLRLKKKANKVLDEPESITI